MSIEPDNSHKDVTTSHMELSVQIYLGFDDFFQILKRPV